LEQTLTKANAAVDEYQRLGASSRQIVETDGRAAIANINAAAAEARSAIATINSTAEGVQGPLTEFTATGLPQLQQSIQGLEDATRSLEGLVDEVRASPRDFIGRPASRELEVQP
jgi:phospholipid/cholesterol/gamma-HCH transport system substrate-binding protein